MTIELTNSNYQTINEKIYKNRFPSEVTPGKKSSYGYTRSQTTSDINRYATNIASVHDKENFYPKAAELISRKITYLSPVAGSRNKASLMTSSTSSLSTNRENTINQKPNYGHLLLFYFDKEDFALPKLPKTDPAAIHPNLIKSARSSACNLLNSHIAKTCLLSIRSCQIRVFYRKDHSEVKSISFRNIIAVDSQDKSWLNIITKSSSENCSSNIKYTCHSFAIDPYIHTSEQHAERAMQFIQEIQENNSKGVVSQATINQLT